MTSPCHSYQHGSFQISTANLIMIFFSMRLNRLKTTFRPAMHCHVDTKWQSMYIWRPPQPTQLAIEAWMKNHRTPAGLQWETVWPLAFRKKMWCFLLSSDVGRRKKNMAIWSMTNDNTRSTRNQKSNAHYILFRVLCFIITLLISIIWLNCRRSS